MLGFLCEQQSPEPLQCQQLPPALGWGRSVPVLDGFGLAAAVPHDLGDVLGLTPGTLVREEGELVYGRWSGQEQRWEQGPHHKP